MLSKAEQQQLSESVERFVRERYARERWRAIAGSPDGLDPAIWREMAELGWLGLCIPEADGGLGGGSEDLAVLMERFGAGLVPDPYLSTVVIGGGLIARHGTAAQRADLLPRLGEGALKLALADTERHSRYDIAATATTATAGPGGWRLDGEKRVVRDAPSSDLVITAARTAGQPGDRDGITLFLVPADAAGLERRDYPTVDRRRAADLRLAGCIVDGNAVLGPVGGGADLLEDAAGLAIGALASESVGLIQTLLDTTVEYLRTRTQFGKTLASFQVLQHRMVDMFAAVEEARATALMAALAAADPRAGRRELHVAKLKIGQCGRFVGQSAIQLHGAIGMTDEYLVGDYVKRLEAIEVMFGNADHHLRALAKLQVA